MAINFNILNPQSANQPKSGIVAVGSAPPVQAPQSGGAEGGIGELLSGLKGLVGAFGPKSPDVASPNGPLKGYVSNALGFGKGQNTDQPLINQQVQSTLGGEGGIFGTASKLIGTAENNPIMRDYLQKANPGLDPTKTPWCAAFVGSVLGASGAQGTGSLAAKSYLKFGNPTDKPTKGDIVVLNRGSDPALGHVGFYAGTDANGNVQVLGGNQGNSVSIKSFPSSQVVGYRQVPTASQVQQFAGQNGIQNPNQLANITTQQTAGVGAIPKASEPISKVIQGSRSVYQNNPVMGDIAAAQAILESGLGDGKGSRLARDDNNYFGIKGSGTAGSTLMPTQEFIAGKMRGLKANFAKNATPEDSFAQHAKLMQNPRYAGVMSAKTPEEAAIALQNAGYATDPGYAKKLIGVYNKYVKPTREAQLAQAQTQQSPVVPRASISGLTQLASNAPAQPGPTQAPASPQSDPNNARLYDRNVKTRDLTPSERDRLMKIGDSKVNWQLLNIAPTNKQA